MNDRSDNPAASAVDPVVSANYRLIADEKAPEDLNRQVLREAENRLRSNGWQYSIAGWLRPLGFVAAAGLSLALFLELNETSVVAPLTTRSADSQQQTTTVPMPVTAQDDAFAKRTAAETASALRREKSVTAVSSKLAAPAAVQREETAAPVAAQQFVAPATGTNGRCNDTQKADVMEWWQCVVLLRRAGANDIAALEFESLRTAYPDFVTPE